MCLYWFSTSVHCPRNLVTKFDCTYDCMCIRTGICELICIVCVILVNGHTYFCSFKLQCTRAGSWFPRPPGGFSTSFGFLQSTSDLVIDFKATELSPGLDLRHTVIYEVCLRIVCVLTCACTV